MRSDRDYLEFIEESIGLVASYTGSGRENFMVDVGNQDQVLRRMEVLADAAGHLSLELRERNPSIDWSAIAGFRNRVVHGYLDVNLDLVWEAVSRLPELQRAVDHELERFRDHDRDDDLSR